MRRFGARTPLTQSPPWFGAGSRREKPQRNGGLSPRRPMAGKAQSREANEHHRPGRGLGNRAANGEVEAKATGPVSDKRVAKGQVDIGPEVRAQIDDVIPEETLGDRQAPESRIENFDAIGGDGEFHRLEAHAGGKAGQ